VEGDEEFAWDWRVERSWRSREGAGEGREVERVQRGGLTKLKSRGGFAVQVYSLALERTCPVL